MSFDVFGLHNVLLASLRNAGFSDPTPVQAQAIPPVLDSLDVMACAQTGTGKTAAFVLPSLHRLLTTRPRNDGRGPRLLVLTPTRELAQQVAENVKLLAPSDRLRVGVVVGGVAYPPQNRLLSQKLDILVATPGRLIDHMQEGRVDLSRVDILVLDEADRMLDMGFQKPVERIVAETPSDRQTLLFSATFSDGVRKIGRQMQKSPVQIELAPTIQRHDSITQSVILVDDRAHKLKILETLLRDSNVWQAIVFVGTKRYADVLAEKLNDRDIPCAALHGDMRQNARRRTLEALHKNKLRVLVATDVAARGIDVKDLSHVFNFDLPQVAEDYVHRIGRTGRAGATGEAVSLVSPQDVGMLREIEKLMATKIERTSVEGMESRQGEAAFERQAASLAPKGKGKGRGKPSRQGSGFGGKFAKSEKSASRRDGFGKTERRSEGYSDRPQRERPQRERDASLDSGWGARAPRKQSDDSRRQSQGNWAGDKSSSFSGRRDKPRSEGKSWGDKPRSSAGRSEGKSWGGQSKSFGGGKARATGGRSDTRGGGRSGARSASPAAWGGQKSSLKRRSARP